MDQIGATAVITNKHVFPPLRARSYRTGARMSAADGVASADDQRTWMEAIARRRDRSAFGALFEHFAPRIKAYLMRSGSDAETAEELVQEALLTVWRRADTFDASQASVATWIFTIARNKRIDGLRRMRRPEFDPQDPALMPTEERPADDLLSAAQSADVLRAAIKTLPAEQMEMLRMAFFEDKPHSQIAAETDVPLGTVKSRLRLAMGRLRKEIGTEV